MKWLWKWIEEYEEYEGQRWTKMDTVGAVMQIVVSAATALITAILCTK